MTLPRAATILRKSGWIALIGVGPLLLYGLVGPSDGNPIGLGLLALVAVPVALLGVAIGAMKWLWERRG